MDMNITELPYRRLNPRDAAQVLGISEGTLRNMRFAGVGPVCYRRPGASEQGARYYYVLSDLMKWMEDNPGERIDPAVQKNAEVAYGNKKTA